MKSIFNITLLLISLILIFPFQTFTQKTIDDAFSYEVHRVYRPLSISSEELNTAKTIRDLNPYYKPSWVKEFKSVEIQTIIDGIKNKVSGPNDVLLPAQKDILIKADIGSTISVNIHYIPENTLADNQIKKFDFSFEIYPEIEATFPGGDIHLLEYLHKKVMNRIPDGIFKDYDLAVVKFLITETGEVRNVRMFEPFKDEKIEYILLTAIAEMPCWKPAEYHDGTKAEQEFVFLVGNMANCNVNVLNIRRNSL